MQKKLKFKFRFIFFIIDLLKKFNLLKKRKDDQKYNRILVISTTGIGDTMWGTPALKVLRRALPKSHITLLVSSLSKQIFTHNPHFDEMITLQRNGGFYLLKIFLRLYQNKYDAILIFHCSYKWLIPFCYLLKPKRYIGFKHDAKMFTPLLTDVLEAKLNHPITQRLMLLEKINIFEKEDRIEIYLTNEEENLAKKFFDDFHFDLSKPLIGLQPGASELFKSWPLNHFIELGKRLQNELGAQIIVFGNKEEIPLAEAISKKIPIFQACGKLPLRVSAAFMKKMDLFITNDTGPLHLSIAQNIPTVVMFSPTPFSLCWPHFENPRLRIISKPLPCITCVSKQCKLPYCMERIEVKEVLEKAKELFFTTKRVKKKFLNLDYSDSLNLLK